MPCYYHEQLRCVVHMFPGVERTCQCGEITVPPLAEVYAGHGSVSGHREKPKSEYVEDARQRAEKICASGEERR